MKIIILIVTFFAYVIVNESLMRSSIKLTKRKMSAIWPIISIKTFAVILAAIIIKIIGGTLIEFATAYFVVFSVVGYFRTMINHEIKQN